MISHYVEMETRVESNESGSSDPRLGSLLVLNAVSLPTAYSQEGSRDETTHGRGGNDTWAETPDLRPGDLLVIKSPHLGSR